ncbi:5-methyltetrahydrofolate--homocysteine methyltransferase [Halioxenophilus aromaticivorans]|uniref:5-methyltetrahydrofolate--homocysteine methyltransferase n=1 Tax=Halioxenophilus aromaticivorans TaxID=1306992 RepID=A0AAV3U8Y0_9ALTE
MNFYKKQLLAFSVTLASAALLTGCGDAETNIVENEAIVEESEEEVGESDTSSGRLFLLDKTAVQAHVYDLSTTDLLATIPLDALPSAVYASGDYRFASLIERTEDKVGFVDGGLWQEPHDDHYDTYSTTPALMNNSLTGSRPTHFVRHEGKVAVFMDGDAATGAVAGVQVFEDHHIEDAEAPATLEFTMNMHGVAEPRGEYLISTIRREDALSTSNNFILPDQVGVYHLHDEEFELEQTIDLPCPDLHGAAQNESHVAFGCSDGILVLTDNGDGTFAAEKLANPDDLEDGLRIGSLWGHYDSGQFIALASAHGGSTSQLYAVDPDEGEIEAIDWQPEDGASAVARGFGSAAEQFLILDDQGYLTAVEPHDEGDHTHWEFGARLDISEEDVSTMPDGESFSMTLARNGHFAYVADPIAQHVLVIDLGLLEITGDIETDFVPSSPTWLGIASE